MHEAIQHLGEDAAKIAALPLWSLTDTTVVDCLRTAHRLQQTVAALTARFVQQAALRDIPAARGHRTVAGWLRSELLLDPGAARDLAKRAAILHNRPAVEQALVDGAIDVQQAAVIAAAVDAIPATLADALDTGGQDGGAAERASGEQVAAHAEAVLLDMAGRFPADHLRRLGERILAHVAPEIADRADEAALRRLEERARRTRFFTMAPPRDGMVRLSGMVGVEDAAVINAAMQPLCGPVTGDDRTPGQRRADALVDICRLALRTGTLPEDGGEPPQVVVTVPFDPLAHALGTAVTDTGERVSAETARRLACDARILPVVLGGAGQVLDAGRSRRLATGALRRALVARDRGCAFPGCDRPARWCDAHHLRSWADGGATSLDNLVLLCRYHHGLIHDPASGWSARLGSDGLPEFVPPPWTDPAQRPRRNLYHPRT